MNGKIFLVHRLEDSKSKRHQFSSNWSINLISAVFCSNKQADAKNVYEPKLQRT